MGEESIIKGLYDHFDELNFGFRPNGSKYKHYELNRDKAYNKLMDAMSDEAKELFEKFEDAEGSLQYMREREIYRQGVCLGVKFTAEAFVVNENRSDTDNND